MPYLDHLMERDLAWESVRIFSMISANAVSNSWYSDNSAIRKFHKSLIRWLQRSESTAGDLDSDRKLDYLTCLIHADFAWLKYWIQMVSCVNDTKWNWTDDHFYVPYNRLSEALREAIQRLRCTRPRGEIWRFILESRDVVTRLRSESNNMEADQPEPVHISSTSASFATDPQLLSSKMEQEQSPAQTVRRESIGTANEMADLRVRKELLELLWQAVVRGDNNEMIQQVRSNNSVADVAKYFLGKRAGQSLLQDHADASQPSKRKNTSLLTSIKREDQGHDTDEDTQDVDTLPILSQPWPSYESDHPKKEKEAGE